MPEPDRLGAQVALVVVIGREDMRHPFGDRNAALREATCKSYPNSGGTPIFKPTGLLGKQAIEKV